MQGNSPKSEQLPKFAAAAIGKSRLGHKWVRGGKLVEVVEAPEKRWERGLTRESGIV